MGARCIGRNTTSVGKLQVAIQYIFDLAVRNVGGQIAFIFSRGCISLSHKISKADRNC